MTRCEAMVQINGRWTRCFRSPADLHHRLTRSRGGLLLDEVGEKYHLMYLCRRHHAVAHDQGSAFENGLLLDGYVLSGSSGPEYHGSDRYLAAAYPVRDAVAVPSVQEVVRGAEPSPRLRGEA